MYFTRLIVSLQQKWLEQNGGTVSRIIGVSNNQELRRPRQARQASGTGIYHVMMRVQGSWLMVRADWTDEMLAD